ncbi:hypothetical protein ACH5A7_06800 [Streptomyces sp. NPDC018955]|uniref:hypothetical protein n=1 Tax=Streptomyces sp. NPDC018955 TaxID=3365055 RepID=UPI0037B307DD
MTSTVPIEEPPAGTSRLRGRHRKPRPRKALLAAGGLAVAASAVTLVRLVTTQGDGTDVGAEAGPHPVLHTDTGTPTGSSTASPARSEAAGPAPEASPSSPTALGGKDRAPLTASEPSSTARPPTTVPATASDPATRPPAARRSQPPAPPSPSPPGTPPPAPRDPAPERPDGPDPGPGHDPDADPGGLCVPIIGLCVGGGLDLGGRD